MAKKYTVEEFRQRLMAIADPKKLGKSITTPLRKGQRDIGYELKKHYWNHKLGRIVWDWRTTKFGVRSGPVIKTRKKYDTRWSNSERAYVAKVLISGLAAKIEEGGRLEVHKMWGKAERRPGVMVSRSSAKDRIIDQQWPGIIAAIEESFGRFIEKTL